MKSLVCYITESNKYGCLIWIDDIRNPNDVRWKNWITAHFRQQFEKIVWLKSYNEVTSWIDKNGLPDAVSFDHDLGDVNDPDNEKTGYDCCKYIVDFCMDNELAFPKYAIQSDNGPGAENIDKYIKNFNKYCR